MPQPKSHIFISYNRKDSAFALQLARDLRTAGAEVWIDQLNIAPGANWDYEVQKALSGCATFLVVLTPAAVASEHVLDEIHFALQEGKRIIPVLLESCSIPMRLSRKQHIDFTGDQQRGRGRLFASLGLKMPAAEKPAQPARAQKPVEKPVRPKPVEKEPAIPARGSTPGPRRQSGVIWLGSLAGVAVILLLVWYFGMQEDSPPAGRENMPVISLADSLYKQRLARGNTFLANGQLDSAKAAFQKALDYKKDDPIAINMLTRIDSIETAEKKKASDQLQFTQNRNDGDRHYDTGRWQEAKIAYTDALKYQDDRMI
ncbi:MAG: TIR domain-containing protein, partial [bacterium]